MLLLAVALLCLMMSAPARAAAPDDPGDTDAGLDLALLRQDGWSFPMSLPRRMRLVVAEERRADGTMETGGDPSPGADYVHLGYSDGASVLSVFIQRGRLDAGRLANWHVQERNGHTIWVQGSGGTNAIWSSGDYVYTVLADAPADMVDAAVAALPHEGEPGFWQRLTRGMDRVLAWANPFD
jgi:sigma-E factor negative regulatory protein RseB